MIMIDQLYKKSWMIWGGVIVAFFLLSGCQTQRRQFKEAVRQNAYPSFETTNYTLAPIPCCIQRVAVLPLSSSEQLEERDLVSLDQILARELRKTTLFEVISINRDQLESLGGIRQLSPKQPMSVELYEKLTHQLGADAVLYSELSAYHPYRPLCMGLSVQLIDSDSQKTVWAFDHVFDSAALPVQLGATRYAESLQATTYPFNEKATILLSPRLFFQYVAFEAFRPMMKAHIQQSVPPVIQD